MGSYDFHTLSPTDFEVLVCQLLRGKLGIELKVFGHGPDGGVDLKHTSEGVTTVVQCKHYRGSSFSDLKRAAGREKSKIDLIKPDKYYFVTSQDLSLTQHEALRGALDPWLQDDSQIYAQKDLNFLLDEQPEVEQRNFKLWMASTEVLRRIVQSGVWERSEALLEEIQDRVRLYVTTKSFDVASSLLTEKSICVITGAPGVGKSMLADMLTLTHWHAGWQIVSLSSHELDRAWDVWNSEKSQLFHFDDVFGQTDVRERLRNDSGPTLAKLMRRVRSTPGKRIVVTTRTHVLREAEDHDETLERANLSLSECVVQVTEYDRMHKARILCNHLYFGECDRSEVRKFILRRAHLRVIEHPNFTPRIIEQVLVQHSRDAEAMTLERRMLRALDAPIALWGPSFKRSLSDAARWSLLHLASFPTFGAPVDDLRSIVVEKTSPIQFSAALRQLEGSWVRIAPMKASPIGPVITFQDPSCRDFVLSYLESEPDYLLSLIRGATDVVQLTQVLRYGQAIGQDRVQKFPELRRVILEYKEEVSLLIPQLWGRRTYLQDWLVVETLASVADMSLEYELGLDDWVMDQILTISARLGEDIADDSSACAELARRIANSDRQPCTLVEFDSLVHLMYGWCAEDLDADGWRDFCDFRDWLAKSSRFELAEADHQAIEQVFTQWLDAELEVVMDNAGDPETARSWANDLEQLTKESFRWKSHASTFASFEASVYEKWDNYEPDYTDYEYLRSSQAVSDAGQRDNSLIERIEDRRMAMFEADDSEEGRIEAMFRQLHQN